MSSEKADRIRVPQLFIRYDLGKTAVYKRMAALGIEPKKLGNRAYVTAEQLALLDELHEHIKSGGITAEFVADGGFHTAPTQPTEPAAPSVQLSSGLVLNQTDIWKLIWAISAEIVAKFGRDS